MLSGTRKGELLLRLFPFASSGGRREFGLCGHGPSEAADVVLKEAVFRFEFIVVVLGQVDPFREVLQCALYVFCTSIQLLLVCVFFRCGQTTKTYC